MVRWCLCVATLSPLFKHTLGLILTILFLTVLLLFAFQEWDDGVDVAWVLDTRSFGQQQDLSKLRQPKYDRCLHQHIVAEVLPPQCSWASRR